MSGGVPRLEGLKPRNASCVHCGYLFNGIPIHGSAIVCPECGKVSSFNPPSPAAAAGIEPGADALARVRRGILRALLILLAFLLAFAAIVIARRW